MKNSRFLPQDPFFCLAPLSGHPDTFYYDLNLLGKRLGKCVTDLPVTLQIVLESMIRKYDKKKITEADIFSLTNYNPLHPEEKDIPFSVARILLQDFTGVPLLADLVSMRDALLEQGFDPGKIEPSIPVDLIIDHSIQVDRSGTADALLFNLELEFQRNRERYEFLRFGSDAFKTFRVIPPGIGIVHQINLEYLATPVIKEPAGKVFLAYPDSLIGTDSHTTMINALGIPGWGVGGIEAEAAMLGQPYPLQLPKVVGVRLTGRLDKGVTGTDLALFLTEKLRERNVVGKFVEFFGEGAGALSVADRATVANMAPEYGATTGFFPADERTLEYLVLTGRTPEQVRLVKDYLTAQGLFGIPDRCEKRFSEVLTFELDSIVPRVAGPKRPQDGVPLPSLQRTFTELLSVPEKQGGFGVTSFPSVTLTTRGYFHPAEPHITGGTSDPVSEALRPKVGESEMVLNRPITPEIINPGYLQHGSYDLTLRHGSIVIAAVTSCTNTSNPRLMIAAGLLAKKAVERGLSVPKHVKTGLAPGSRAVTDYLKASGLQSFLDRLGFQTVAYGCTTCIGNSGPLDETIENAIRDNDLVVASVLSGNRNFEARIHAAVKANFLMSPPLVIAFALAGKIDIDITKESLGSDSEGKPVFFQEILPSEEEIDAIIRTYVTPKIFRDRYAAIDSDNPMWNTLPSHPSLTYPWDPASTYIRKPPFLETFESKPRAPGPLQHMRALALLGDSVTTDHISPAGSFKASSPAGQYLLSQGISEKDFNSYGSRRGNHLIMARATFANVRLRNLMVERSGGFTKLFPEGTEMTIFEAAEHYRERNIPLIVFAGKDYGMGSSRDWAAKGSALLGVKVVVAQSFERIHRSNLIGMGILPLLFPEGISIESLGITGKEEFSLSDYESLFPGKSLTLTIDNDREISLRCALNTPTEIEYYLAGGILPYVLREIIGTIEELR